MHSIDTSELHLSYIKYNEVLYVFYPNNPQNYIFTDELFQHNIMGSYI